MRLTSAEFAEVAATHLCLPSPACAAWVGAQIGDSVVDAFGDNIRSELMGEDGFRERHDMIKNVLNRLSKEMRIRVRCEVFAVPRTSSMPSPRILCSVCMYVIKQIRNLSLPLVLRLVSVLYH